LVGETHDCKKQGEVSRAQARAHAASTQQHSDDEHEGAGLLGDKTAFSPNFYAKQ